MSLLTCASCMEEFSTSRLPLILECYHTFCGTCISKLISVNNKPECPKCRANIKYDTCREIPKNYIVLESIVEKCENIQSDRCKQTALSEAYCPEHEIEMDKWCDTHQVCICTSCTSSESDPPHPLATCSVRDLDLSILRQTSFITMEEFMSVFANLKTNVMDKHKKLLVDKTSFKRQIADIKCKMDSTGRKILLCEETESKLEALTQEITKHSMLVQDAIKTSEGVIYYEKQKKLQKEANKWMDDTIKDLPIYTEDLGKCVFKSEDNSEGVNFLLEKMDMLKQKHETDYNTLKQNHDIYCNTLEMLKQKQEKDSTTLKMLEQKQARDFDTLKQKQEKDFDTLKQKQEKDSTSLTMLKQKQEKDFSTLKQKQEKDLDTLKQKQEKYFDSLKQKPEKYSTTITMLEQKQARDFITLKQKQENDFDTLKQKQEKDFDSLMKKQEKDSTSLNMLEQKQARDFSTLKQKQEKDLITLNTLKQKQNKDCIKLKQRQEKEFAALKMLIQKQEEGYTTLKTKQKEHDNLYFKCRVGLIPRDVFRKYNYVVVKTKNKTLFGRVWTDDNKTEAVFISNFKPKTPPFNSKIIELSDICSEEKFNQQNCYIRVSIFKENYEEMLTVSLHKNNDFARNFFLLCNGLKGLSYEGCPFESGNHHITSGCYQKDWTEGAAVLENFDINNCTEEDLKIGNVCGRSHLNYRSRFFVNVIEHKYKGFVFGRITSGLDVCKYLFKKLENKSNLEVIISDCGVQVMNLI